MPRGSGGTYTLPVAAFIPGGLIKSADDNSNFSDIATALTQSLATTGVSTMTGPVKGSSGSVATPAFTFAGGLSTGFYLAGSNQIGIGTNGIQAATVNSDQSVTFNGTVSAAKGTVPIGAVMDFAGSVAPSGWLLCFGQSLLTASYVALQAAIGYTYGGAGANFNLPDYRGRSSFGQDNMGGVAANRITVAGKNFDGTVLGGTQDNQNYTILTANLPAYTPTGSVASTLNGGSGNQGLQSGTGGSVNIGGTGSGGTNVALSITSTFTGVAQGGTSTPFGIIPNAIIANKIIYAGV